MQTNPNPYNWWRVDGGGGVYFRKSKDLADKIQIKPAPKFSCWRAICQENDWIKCENGYWLPTQYMDIINISENENHEVRRSYNKKRFDLMKEYSTLIPYMKCPDKFKPYGSAKVDSVHHHYNDDDEEEIEISLFMVGLPKTKNISKLKYVILKKSLNIFGSIPLVCDIEVVNGMTTGQAYFEFAQLCHWTHLTYSHAFRLDKKHTLYTKKCFPRYIKSYDPDIINWGYDGHVWFRAPTIEESKELDIKFLEYKKEFGHLSGEIPDDSWKKCEVTDEIWNDYWNKMNSSMKKFNYTNGEDCGTIPKSITKDNCDYKLINYSSHGFVCDNPMCQAMFHKADEQDCGAMGALVYTRLPIYTCRGKEQSPNMLEDMCYVCITK